MSALDDLRLRQEIARDVAEQRKRAPLDRAVVAGGAYVNAGGTGWHDSEGRAIPTPDGYDEHGNRLADLAAVAEPEAEPKAKAKR